MRQALLTRRAALVVGAIGCFALAAVLLTLALDVTHWNDAMRADDVRYRATPEATDLWQPATAMPLDAGRTLLGVRDDVDFRRAVRALRLARLEDATAGDAELALRRNEAQARLEAIAGGDGDKVRRSRAAGLLGALGLARLASETQERVALLEATIGNLQFAIALDPGNEEAKFNLELAIQRGRGLQLTEGAGGTNPSPGGAGSKGAGAGDAGTGY
ncbi:MAG TPA: hypothetical protein VI409_15250 [Gaiellaceae bacterium]|nr:hypothetical protein [Gaiellaceae bacterium]